MTIIIGSYQQIFLIFKEIFIMLFVQYSLLKHFLGKLLFNRSAYICSPLQVQNSKDGPQRLLKPKQIKGQVRDLYRGSVKVRIYVDYL